MKQIPDEFLQWLGRKLNEANLSQSEASRRAGLNQNAISELINHKVQEVSLRTCKSLASLFGEPIEEVFRMAGHLPPSNGDITLKELLWYARSLPPEDLAELIEYAQFRYSKHANESDKPGLRDNTLT